MKVITRYLSTEIIRLFMLCQFIFISLFLVAEFILKLDNFSRAGVSLSLHIAFLVYKIPFIVVMITPYATMISIIAVLCIMKKNKEIMAMKACGLNLIKTLQPVITVALIISFFTFFLSEIIAPYTSSKSNEIWEVDVNKRPQATFKEWYKSSENGIYWIRHYDINTNTINDPAFYFFDDEFHLVKKISGKQCRWTDGKWVVEDAKIQTMVSKGDYSISRDPFYTLDIPETPDTFLDKMEDAEDMSYQELKQKAKKMKAEGYDNTIEMVDLHSKLAFPFVSAVLALIAIPLALWEKIKAIPLAITLGIMTGFLQWITMEFARAFGQSGILPPLVAAWTSNILFALIGINLLMNLKR